MVIIEIYYKSTEMTMKQKKNINERKCNVILRIKITSYMLIIFFLGSYSYRRRVFIPKFNSILKKFVRLKEQCLSFAKTKLLCKFHCIYDRTEEAQCSIKNFKQI